MSFGNYHNLSIVYRIFIFRSIINSDNFLMGYQFSLFPVINIDFIVFLLYNIGNYQIRT